MNTERGYFCCPTGFFLAMFYSDTFLSCASVFCSPCQQGDMVLTPGLEISCWKAVGLVSLLLFVSEKINFIVHPSV